jgi:hypothetical protein
MRLVADYEIKSEWSVSSDDLELRLQHPKGEFQARIKNIPRKDFSRPFLLSLRIFFEAPSLNGAQEVAQGKLTECSI